MAGLLHLDSVGVGGAVGDAIHGGGAGTIMGSWRQRGLVHLAQLEISIHEPVAQVPAHAPWLARIHEPVLLAPIILGREPWPQASARRCRMSPIILKRARSRAVPVVFAHSIHASETSVATAEHPAIRAQIRSVAADLTILLVPVAPMVIPEAVALLMAGRPVKVVEA
jgi:hypothetical protein